MSWPAAGQGGQRGNVHARTNLDSQLACRLPFGKVLVAIANKHARQLWAMLAHEETYDANAWLKHPMVQRPAGKHALTVAAMA